MRVSIMRYRERLTAPLAWWVLSGLFALSLLLAFGFYLGPVWGIGVAIVSFVAVGALLVSASTPIRVTDTELVVGRARIALRYVGDIHPLDGEQARRRRGPDADARAYLVLRPYIGTAVEISINDVADPVPYWLVASRHPARFAEALKGADQGSAR